MRVVAGITLAVNDRLMGIGLGKFDFSFGMAAKAYGVHFVPFHTGETRPVGIVADTALTIGKRLVRFERFSSLYGLLVARETNILLFCKEEFGELGRVPHMTCKTAPVTGNRFVRDAHGNVFIFVTFKA